MKKKKKKLVKTIWGHSQTPSTTDWKILGPSIKKLPVNFWEENMLFFGADDKELKKITEVFPATFKKNKSTHPIFILKKIANIGFKVCPCTSSSRSTKQRYIKKGCILDITSYIMDRNSYLVEDITFNLPRNHTWNNNLIFKGKVPEMCIQG